MSNGHALPLKDRLVVSGEPTPHRILRAQGRPVVSKFKHHHDSPHSPPPPPSRSDADRSLRETCADIHARVERFLAAAPPDAVTRGTQEQTRFAVSVITQALQDYGFEALSLSYNGGKDCLVLLILYLSVLHTHFTQPSGRRKRSTAAAAEAAEGTETNAAAAEAAPGVEEEEEEVGGGDSFFPTSIPSIYAKPPDPFDAVSEFVDESTRDYHLDLTHISTNPGPSQQAKSHSSPPVTQTEFSSVEAAAATTTTATTTVNTNTNGDLHHHPSAPSLPSDTSSQSQPQNNNPIISFRDAFAIYLQTHPRVRAIFVGTRRTDPHGATLLPFQMTDGRWPRFMRVHPVIDWRLSQVWCFLRSPYLSSSTANHDDGHTGTGTGVPYCGMYDAGYTSLGGVGDTVPNPKLRYRDPEMGEVRYRPAYEMVEDDDERAGRE